MPLYKPTFRQSINRIDNPQSMDHNGAMNPRIVTVDEYLEHGCGRCPLWDTPKCKTIIFRDQLVSLRRILNTTELTETLKWSYPCYTFEGKNVLL